MPETSPAASPPAAARRRHATIPVMVGKVTVGGGAPVVVQSMTMTDTADAAATATQCRELAEAGSELVRVTVNVPEAAAAVPEIRKRLLDAGCDVPLIGDFHYNGHLLLTKFPACAAALDKYRINPGNVGTGHLRDEQFSTICRVAVDHGKPVRIGVNGGSLNQELVMRKMQENTDRDLGKSSDEIVGECLVLSALESTELALASGLSKNQIVISVQGLEAPGSGGGLPRPGKTHRPAAAPRPDGGGDGDEGLVWSAAAMGILLEEGIGDTIRVSLTPRPGGDRREEVFAACELLQSLGLRSFAPSVTACPGCGRTTSTTFQELAERIQAYVREKMPVWKTQYDGVETMTLAVMGCIVNGPGESKAANIGISLPGTGEAPSCPVYIDGQKFTTLKGTYDELSAAFRALVDDYIAAKYPRKQPVQELSGQANRRKPPENCEALAVVLARLVLRRLEDLRDVRESRLGHEVREALLADGSEADPLVPVHPATALLLGVVGMDDQDPLEADRPVGFFQHRPPPVSCHDVVPRGPDVAGVEAVGEADLRRRAPPHLRQLREGVAEGRPLSRRRLEEDRRLYAARLRRGRVEAPCDPVETRLLAVAAVRAGVEDEVRDSGCVAPENLVDEGRERAIADRAVRRGEVDQIGAVRHERRDSSLLRGLPECRRVVLVQGLSGPLVRVLRKDLKRPAAGGDSPLDGFGEPAGGAHVSPDEGLARPAAGPHARGSPRL